MADARISRLNVEVVADPGAIPGVTRLDAEVATLGAGASTDPVQVSRVCFEVLAANPDVIALSRLDAEVATLAEQSTASEAVMVSRVSFEALLQVVNRTAISRLDAEVATPGTQYAPAIPIAVSRLSLEAVTRRGSAGLVNPLDLVAGIEVFLHNWVSECTLRTSYLTSIATSPETGSESRRGLKLKPERTMKLVWEEGSNDDLDRARLDRMLVMLRKLTNDRVAIPLYMDQQELAQAYTQFDDTVFFNTSKGRWFLGARVVIVQLDACGSYASHSFHIISDMEDDRLVFDALLGVNVLAGSVILPMMDCEVVLEVALRQPSALHARLELEVQEVAGSSALPPVKADTPSGAYTFDSVPIFDIEPDWSEAIDLGRNRQGQQYRQGRTNRVYKAAARSRQTHRFFVSGDRDDSWRVIEFFDTRRGALRNFWLIDQQQVWECAEIDPVGTYVSVNELGDFADFQAELQGEWIGLVMRDGTIYVREAVTVQQILTIYRITVDPLLPAGLDFNDVVRIARGRRTRFLSDELEERWKNNCYMSTTLEFLETLEEKQADL